MARIDVRRGPADVERPVILDGPHRDRLEKKSDVVAQGMAIHDPPREPQRTLDEQRLASRALVELPPRELVDLVARLAAEELRQVKAAGGDEVNSEMRRAFGRLERGVLHRKAHEEPRRIDARLGRKAEQASLPRPAGGGRHNERRGEDRGREAFETSCDVVAGQGYFTAARNLTGSSWNFDSSFSVIRSGPMSFP